MMELSGEEVERFQDLLDERNQYDYLSYLMLIKVIGSLSKEDQQQARELISSRELVNDEILTIFTLNTGEADAH